jgi:hypothetical protein
MRAHRCSFARGREGRMGAHGCGIPRACGETYAPGGATAQGQPFGARLSWRQKNPRIPRAILAFRHGPGALRSFPILPVGRPDISPKIEITAGRERPQIGTSASLVFAVNCPRTSRHAGRCSKSHVPAVTSTKSMISGKWGRAHPSPVRTGRWPVLVTSSSHRCTYVTLSYGFWKLAAESAMPELKFILVPLR